MQDNKLYKRIRRDVGRAIYDYNMIESGDHIMCCLSGGKDSYTMLDILLNLQQYAPVKFKLTVVNLDQKHPGYPQHILPEYLQAKGVDYHIIEQDTYSIVKEKIPEGKTTCSLCSRLRRGILYKTALKINAKKIALGHHRDDILETFFLNIFYGGQMKAMPPKLLSNDGQHMVIRPLAYCREKDIIKFAKMQSFPIIPCNLCDSSELQRQKIKQMLQAWEKQFPQRVENIFKALQNIVPSHLADVNLFDFKKLSNQDKINTILLNAQSDFAN